MNDNDNNSDCCYLTAWIVSCGLCTVFKYSFLPEKQVM